VLRYRVMVCGVAAPGLALRPYFNRYTEDAIDLCDVLASFSPQNKASLHELCRVHEPQANEQLPSQKWQHHLLAAAIGSAVPVDHVIRPLSQRIFREDSSYVFLLRDR
jgi:3'-5' exonuclease